MDCAFTVVTEFSSSSGEEEYPKGEVVAILLLTILLLFINIVGIYRPLPPSPLGTPPPRRRGIEIVGPAVMSKGIGL